LDVSSEPKGITFSARSGNSKGPVRGVYAMRGDTLVICQEIDPEAPAPTELETVDGDHRMLVKLRRMSATEAAAIKRSSLPRKAHFKNLDKDEDGQLSLDEVLADYPTPEAVKQGTESFKLTDTDHDGKLSMVEFTVRSHRVLFMQADLDANGVLSEMEFTTGGSLKTASAARAHRVFGLIDQDSDGVMSLKEYLNRTRETWFVVFDADENNVLSYDEYAIGNPGLVRAGRCEAVFAAIDRDSDGRLTLDEHINKPRKAYFVHMDRDGDERVTFKEFTVWKNTPQQIEDAKKDFENRDTDRDELLTLEEFTGGGR
jgi:Ca2+-binding EF-hand superfamily protein